MQDFNVEACDAQVESYEKTEDGQEVLVLNQTCFYPRGGGQDWDTGTIKKDSAVFTVNSVVLDPDGNVQHSGKTIEGSFDAGDAVFGEVDRERRFINMRLHSAAHVIDKAVDALGLNWVAVKGQHYPHLSAVEYTGSWDVERSERLKEQIAQRANEFVEQGSLNTLIFMPIDEMHTVCRHVPENIPKNKPGRVVMYGDDFGIPCGGTHLKDIHDVGSIHIPKIKHKKGIIQVSYGVDGIN